MPYMLLGVCSASAKNAEFRLKRHSSQWLQAFLSPGVLVISLIGGVKPMSCQFRGAAGIEVPENKSPLSSPRS